MAVSAIGRVNSRNRKIEAKIRKEEKRVAKANELKKAKASTASLIKKLESLKKRK